MNHKVLWPVVVLAVFSIAVPQAMASTQARISGKVTDSTGKPISGAVITITCRLLPTYEKAVETDGKGRYKVLILDATKRYRFHIEAEGFAPYEQPVKVRSGSMDNEIDFTLRSREEVVQTQQQQVRRQPGFKELEEGLELLEQDQREAARDKFLEAVEAVPDLVNAWIALAELDYELEDFDKALDHSRKCLELDSESSACLAIAANASNRQGDEVAYKAYMARYQELNPDDPATLFNQAVEYLNAMDDESARPILEECLEVDPTFPKCLFEYGMLLLRSGDLEGAKAKLEKYLEVAPDGPDAATARETVKYL